MKEMLFNSNRWDLINCYFEFKLEPKVTAQPHLINDNKVLGCSTYVRIKMEYMSKNKLKYFLFLIKNSVLSVLNLNFIH